MIIPYECRIEECASKDETRAVICDMHLDITDGKGRLVATDGRRMVVLPVEIDPLDTPGCVPAMAVKLARSFASDRHEPYDPADECEESGSPVLITLQQRAELQTGVSVLRTDHKYPDWAANMVKCTTSPEPVTRVSLNAELLVGMQRAFGCAAVTLTFQGYNKPMLVQPADECYCPVKDAKGVLMPVRNKNHPIPNA